MQLGFQQLHSVEDYEELKAAVKVVLRLKVFCPWF